ncbi:Regulator of nonsense transcripts 1 [Aphelenchoides fujianensis]|nr:Regulator of nonsense transcripts 1 [Aphelenchoides fujianensis]
MDDDFDAMSQLSEGFLRSETQSTFPFSQTDDGRSETTCAPTLPDEEQSEEADYETIQLPKHACRYCGIHDTASVALCTVCNKWFCNSKGCTPSSHLITHCVRSGHREITLHPDGQLGDTDLENIFLLGFLKAKTDSVVVMLCRMPCAQTALKGGNWEAEEWKPLIAERQLVSWVLKPPDAKAEARAKQITTSRINRLEELWKENAEATVEDLDLPGLNAEPEHVCLRYEDGAHYFSVLSPLIALEAEYDRKAKEALSYQVTQVRWAIGLNKKTTASFNLPEFRDGNMKLMIGDELRLKHQRTIDGSEWMCEGRIVKIPDNHDDKFVLEVSKSTDTVSSRQTNFTCEYVWKGTAFKRMQEALLRLANKKSCVSQFIYHKLMGHEVNEIHFQLSLPKKFETPGLPALNHSQEDAVRNALLQPLSLIQGPPGTGKTVTSAALVYQMVKVSKEQVLVCSPSNIAADQLAEKLHLTGLKVVRFCAKGRETVESSVGFLALHNQLKALQGAAELHKLMRLKEEVGELSSTDELRFKQLVMVKEKELLGKAEVICSTCISAADARLRGLEFRCVLIDESTQAAEPEIIVPVLKGARQLVLVGDHCQLGPVVMSKQASAAGFAKSLVERLIMLGNRPFRLQVQYRMHPALSVFPSNVFYEGSLQNGVSEHERILHDIDWRFPTPDKPMMFWHCNGQEEISPSGTSYLNRAEATAVEKVTTRFLKAGVRPEQIGIITPYEGQRAFLVQYMQSQGTLHSKLYAAIEVANVDAFQGREKDLIIVTCVRSNSAGGIGFLNDPRRLNVALTRAKYGLILIGNAHILARQTLWHSLISMMRDRGCMVEGPLNNLQKAMIDLPAPRAITDREIQTHGYLAISMISHAARHPPPRHPPAGPFAHKPPAVASSNGVYATYDSHTYAAGGVLPPSIADPQGAMFAGADRSSVVPLHMLSPAFGPSTSGGAFGNGDNVPPVWPPLPSSSS